MRSTAVLIAAGVAMLFPTRIQAHQADAVAAVAVSVIILGSLVPLVCGLWTSAHELYALHHHHHHHSDTNNNHPSPLHMDC